MSRPDVHVVRMLAELEALESEWNALSAPFATPLLDHDWFLAAARTLHDEADLRVVLVRQGGMVTGIAPMVIDRRLSGRLALLGASTLYEPGGWLYQTGEALSALATAILRIGHVIVVHRVPGDSPLCHRLGVFLRGRGVAVRRPAASSLFVDTRQGWSESQSRLSGRAVRRMRALWVRAQREHGEVSVDRVRPAASDVEDLLREFMAVEGSGWKGQRGSALSHRADLRCFFRDYLERAATRGRLIVSRVSLDGVTAAMEVAVQAYERHWTLKIGYDERLSLLGPGILLTDASIQATCREGLTSYEFLGSAEPWQERWKPTRREYQVTVLYPFTSRGLLQMLSDAADYAARRALRRGASWAAA